MRGQRPLKNPALLAGHRRRQDVVGLDHAPVVAPPRCPPGVLPGTANRWRSLWRSRVAQAWDRSSDLPALTRYILLMDRWLRYDELVRQAPLVRGSKDQLRANPLALRMDALEGQMHALEEQLGLTPAARMRLGISLVEARNALDTYLQQSPADDERDPRELLRDGGSPR
jgi:P27 family predicted phage terminase small subunit